MDPVSSPNLMASYGSDSTAPFNPETSLQRKFKWSADWLPCVASFFNAFGALLFGWHIGFSSPTSRSVQNAAELSKDDISLVWSMLAAGAMVGSLVVGNIANAVGRRYAIALVSMLFVIGTFLMTEWVTNAGLILGRLIIGAAVGCESVLVPLYISEISPSHLRGTLSSLNQLFIAGGILLVNVAGFPAITHPDYWKTMLYIGLGLVGMQLFPILYLRLESPSWLVNQGRNEEARAVLTRLRGNDVVVVDAELNSLVLDTRNTTSSSTSVASIATAVVYDSSIRTPFLLGVLLVGFQQWSGINAFVFNTKSLFEEKGVDEDSHSAQKKALVGAIIVNGVQVVFSGLSGALLDRRGRRFFLLLSGIGVTVTCAVMGTVYYYEASNAVKIPVVFTYYAFFAMGLGPVPWVVISEIFPSRSRSILQGVVTVFNWGSAFLVTFSFNKMNETLTTPGTFWFFGAICVVGK